MKKLIIANWKMNPQSSGEARSLASEVEQGLLAVDRAGIEVVICPPFVFLPVVRHAIHFAKLGVQDISAKESGPFTGQISASQVREFNCNFSIIGHSERRLLGEDDSLIHQKIKMALKYKIEPILCVGSGTKKSSTAAVIKRVIKRQLQAALRTGNLSSAKLTIAYEPVWAISRGLGTGKAVKPRHAAEIIGFIKSRVPQARVIYGGSIDSKNANGFAACKEIQGGLVGGASLHAREFLKIIQDFGDIK